MAIKRTDEEIIACVKDLRKKRKLTQGKVAELMHYSNASRVSEFEKGKTKNILEFVERFCKSLEIDMSTVLFKEDITVTTTKDTPKVPFRYKVPNFKYSLFMGLLIIPVIVLQIISTLNVNNNLMMWSVGVASLILLIELIFFIIQWTSSENYIDEVVEDRKNVQFVSDDKREKHPIVKFILIQISILFGLTFVLILFCGVRVEVSVILIYFLMLLFEIFSTVFGINLFKKANKTSGFKVYIFESIVLVIELIFSSLVAYGLQISNINAITYYTLSFNEMMLLYVTVRMIDCNFYLKNRKIISEKR